MSNINANGRTPEERFWSRVDRSAGPDACWPWRGARQTTGYGRVRVSGRLLGAHRVALEYSLGRSLGTGMAACHHCDNPPCCNPAHLFEATNLENDLDKIVKDRSNRGERHGHARLTPEVVLAIRQRAAHTSLTHGAIAAEFGISRRLASRVISRERWTHL